MELDELKKAWGQFNTKVDGQMLVEKGQIEQMLSKKKRGSYNKLLWYERICLLFLLFASVAITSIGFYSDFFWEKICMFALGGACLITFGFNSYRYHRLSQARCMKYDLEHQIVYMLQYKSSLYWGSVTTYVALIPSVILLIVFSDIFWACIIVGWIVLVVILDILVFRHISGKVTRLIEINKELARLKELLSN